MLKFVSSTAFDNAILALIVLNAVTLGLETYPAIMRDWGSVLLLLDKIFLGIFVTELLLKLAAHGRSFFRDRWQIFDFGVIFLTLLPMLGIEALGNLSALRAVRLLRLLSLVPAFRHVLAGIVRALSGSAAVMAVLFIIVYVYAVISVKLFRTTSPESFADLGTAAFTFFQIMTLDNWSEIVKPIMAAYWWAGPFFVSFVLLAVFLLLSIIIGIASDAMRRDR